MSTDVAPVAPEEDPLSVEVAYCASPGLCDSTTLRLGAGATLHDAVIASGISHRHPEVTAWLAAATQVDGEGRFGVWGKLRSPTHVLRDGDRVEIYRPLLVDPMEARRRRQKSQRSAAV